MENKLPHLETRIIELSAYAVIIGASCGFAYGVFGAIGTLMNNENLKKIGDYFGATSVAPLTAGLTGMVSSYAYEKYCQWKEKIQN